MTAQLSLRGALATKQSLFQRNEGLPQDFVLRNDTSVKFVVKKMKGITYRIIIGGFGGQGVLTLGKLLAYAGMEEKKYVSCLPSYGAEMRGGYAFCTLIISTEEIPSPVVSKADIGIFMDRLSLEKYKEKIKKNGTILINSSLIKNRFPQRNLKVIRILATEMAERIGDVRIANMVAAGALLKTIQSEKKNFLSLFSLQQGLKRMFPQKPELFDLNKKAIEEGEKASLPSPHSQETFPR